MSIKLHGMAYSNYYNMAKAIMLEKGMAFEEVHVLPNQEEEYLLKSPMGKVPVLETEQGFISETAVMIDYIDALGVGPSLYPEGAFERAKVQEIIRYLELYIELPARRLYGDAFFDRPAGDDEKAIVRAQLEKGFTALARLTKFNPYIAGEELSYADFYFQYSVGTATLACKKSLGWNALGEIPNIKELMSLMGERESVKKVKADQG